MEISKNQNSARKIRLKILEILFKSKAGHFGTSMSLVEILVAIYSGIDTEKIKNNRPDRDRIILSKGHGAAALYATLNVFGIIEDEILETYHLKNSKLLGHVSHLVKGVEHSTGSLGHGLSVAIGQALGSKNSGFKNRIFVICGDGELQEGSCWEALMFASTHKLGNVFILVDNNRISSITETDKVINTGLISDRFKGFGLKTYTVDGHDVSEIQNVINKHDESAGSAVIVCQTTKGKGFSFSENQPIWHYKTIDENHYELAKRELQSAS